MKYIVTVGGVLSGIGKGTAVSSMGVLLKACGLRVVAVKCDPYLSVSSGLLSPYEHGECFVLADGWESDLDLGNYERWLDVQLTGDSNITSGKVFSAVLAAERRGDYLGKTVQMIPHVTDMILTMIDRAATSVPADVCLIEIGGTVGDIESQLYLEAVRQLQQREAAGNVMLVHVSLVPAIGGDHEQKTKPTQHSVKELRSVGLFPDVILCRSEEPLCESTRAKLAMFCQVPSAAVLSVHNVPNIYHVPLLLEEQGLTGIIVGRLGLAKMAATAPDLTAWRNLAESVEQCTEECRIAIVGKYTGLSDSYLSVLKALEHACTHWKRKLTVVWIDASELESPDEVEGVETYTKAWSSLRSADGILVPGGFGDRGVNGKIAAIRYARERGVPFLGICLGLQCAVIEHCRNVLGWKDATSAEFEPNTACPVIMFMPEIDPTQMGGNMRLGAKVSVIRCLPVLEAYESLAQRVYNGATTVTERHRHRYEVNPAYIDSIQCTGLFFTGTDTNGERMEIAERRDHPFFFATQAHPEFQSYPGRPSLPFKAFIAAAAAEK